MNIIDAVRQVKVGKKIKRKDWNNTYLKTDLLLYSGGKSFILSDCFNFHMEDILADDWEVIDEHN